MRARHPHRPLDRSEIHPLGLALHCPGTSVAHPDGGTECELPGCQLPHALHRWQAACADVDGPCHCGHLTGSAAA